MHLLKIAAIGFAIFILSGCTTYRYGDRTFNDRKEAEIAQKGELNTLRAGIKARSTPLVKAGKVVIPSKTLVIDRRTNEGASTEARDYVASTLYIDYRNTAEAIGQRNIFTRLEIEESTTGDHVTPKEDEVVVYLYMPDKKTGGWYYISKTTKRTPISFDFGNPDKVGRFKYFIDSIEALSAGETN